MKTLEQWTRKLSEKEMPVLARTAHEISHASENEECSIGEMAGIVLQDSSMTARVLKLANSIFYNPTPQPIRTVSRAVLVLGFDAVRSLCLSATLIGTMIKEGPHRDRVIHQMARAFHAAVQARALAAASGMRSPEEIYITTLLYRLGDMAFWCFGGPQAEALAAALEQPDANPAEAEEAILGFRLSRLTLALNKEWHLTPLLNAAIEGREGPRIEQIRLAVELGEKAELGWGHPDVLGVLERISQTTGIPMETLKPMVHGNAEQAAEVAGAYGAPGIGKLIPTTHPVEIEDNSVAEPVGTDGFQQPDPMLQLQILRDISGLLTEGKPDIGLLFNMVLEGIHRGIGMDRTVLALLAPDRKNLRAKHTLGWGQQDLMQRFHFSVFQENDVFSRTLEAQGVRWFRNEPDESGIIGPHIHTVLGKTPFFIAALGARGRAIGLIYTDRRQSHRELDEEAFASFKNFAQQANLGLMMLQQRG